MSKIRTQMIRLAYENPELRADLLPLLKTAASWQLKSFSGGGMTVAQKDGPEEDARKYLATQVLDQLNGIRLDLVDLGLFVEPQSMNELWKMAKSLTETAEKMAKAAGKMSKKGSKKTAANPPKGVGNSKNPVEMDRKLKGKKWEVAVDSGERVVAVSTGWKQWQYAGRGNAWEIKIPTGKKVWTTGIAGDYYVIGKAAGEKTARKPQSKWAGAKETFEIIVDSWSIESTEDSFDEGEIGRGQLLDNGRNVGTFKSPDEVIKYFIGRSDAPKDKKAWTAFEDGRLICGWHGDENGYAMSSKEMEKWKKGEIKGYSIDLNIYLKFAKVWEPTPKEISQVFKIQTY